MDINSLQRQRRLITGTAGFSLLELMIVVGILGLLVALLTPNFMESVRRGKLKQAVTELNGGLTVSRMSAMSRNRTVTIKLVGASTSTSGSNVTVTGTSATPITVQFTDSKGLPVIPTQVLSTDIVQADTIPGVGSPVVSQVQFNSLGQRIGGGATVNQLITLKNFKGLTYSLHVTPAGKTRWCPQATCS